MKTLTFVTGVLDTVGYLGLDRIFTGNMTGNIVILGMGMASEDDSPVAGPVAALLAHLVGAAGAGRLLRRHPGTWTVTTALFLTSAGVLAVVATILAAVNVGGASWGAIGIASAIAAVASAAVEIIGHHRLSNEPNRFASTVRRASTSAVVRPFRLPVILRMRARAGKVLLWGY